MNDTDAAFDLRYEGERRQPSASALGEPRAGFRSNGTDIPPPTPATNPPLSFPAKAGNDTAVSPLDRSHSSKTRSVVKRGSDLPLKPGGVIVLDPQLRVVLFHEFFDHLAALRGLLPVGVEERNFLVRDLFRIVIEIARQQDAPGVGELEKQGLVPGRMTRRGLDDHGAVAKYIMILAVQHNRFAVGEPLEKFRVRHAPCCRRIGRPRST